jgi:hypothetical protein
MLSAIGASYIWYLNNYVPNIDGDLNSVLEADRINYTIYFISLITVVISIYAQRHSEAKKSAKLIKEFYAVDLDEAKPMSLAEIFYYDSDNHGFHEPKKPKVGFN